MQSVELNLASRPFHNNTLYWLGYGLGAVLLLAATFWNASAYVDYSQRLKNLSEIEGTIEKKTAELQRRDNAAQRAIAGYNIGDMVIQVAKANDVIDAKAFSWTRLFNQLENVLPYTVRMLSVRPQFRFGQQGRRQADNVPAGAVPIAVEGVARDLRAILDFERSLMDDVHFSRVEPDRVALTAERQERLFTLRFLYYPEGNPVEVAELAAAEAAAVAEAEAAAAAAEAEAAAAAEAERVAETGQPVQPEGVETEEPAGDGGEVEPSPGPSPSGEASRTETVAPQANVVKSGPPEPAPADSTVMLPAPIVGEDGDDDEDSGDEERD